MHGKNKFVFLWSEYSELKCSNTVEIRKSIYVIWKLLKMPSTIRIKSYDTDVMRLKCLMYG